MTATAVTNAYHMVRIECAQQLVDRTSDLQIKDPTLHRIKAVFNHFRVNVFEGLSALMIRIQEHYNFSHAIYFYEEESYPCEIVMVREISFEYLNVIHLTPPFDENSNINNINWE